MSPPDPAAAPGLAESIEPVSGRLRRFTRGERAVHHVTGLLMIICLGTAACLYIPSLAAAVGRRELIKTVHVWAGFALPLPIMLGVLSRAFRADLRRLNRFGPHDWEWLRRADRRAVLHGRGVVPVGKFNAGQKLNAAFVVGAIIVMLGTGAMLTYPGPFPDEWRTGATFVHDWLTIAIFAMTLGHLWYALRDPGAMAGMLTGRVGRDWAATHHAGWLDEIGTTRATGRPPPPEPATRARGDEGH